MNLVAVPVNDQSVGVDRQAEVVAPTDGLATLLQNNLAAAYNEPETFGAASPAANIPSAATGFGDSRVVIHYESLRVEGVAGHIQGHAANAIGNVDLHGIKVQVGGSNKVETTSPSVRRRPGQLESLPADIVN